MQLVNIITKIRAIQDWGSANLRSLDGIKHIVIHHNSVKTTGLQIARWFRDEGYKWTRSHRMSYHFWIKKDGTVEQCLPLDVNAPAARGMNQSGIQICLAGNFETSKPTREQWAALIELCTALKRAFPQAHVLPHQPTKPCPGKNIHFPALHKEILERLEIGGRNGLIAKGITL